MTNYIYVIESKEVDSKKWEINIGPINSHVVFKTKKPAVEIRRELDDYYGGTIWEFRVAKYTREEKE